VSTRAPGRASQPIQDVRRAAKRQAQALPAGLLVAFAMLAAVAAVAVFVLLDYRFGQDPHRLIKILAGVTFLTTIILQPRVGLFFLPLLVPFLGWTPRIPIPGVNTLYVLLFSIFFTWSIARVFRREPLFRPGRLAGVLLALLVLAALSIVRGSAFPTGYQYNGLASGLELFRAATAFTIYFIALAMVRGSRDRTRLTWAVVLALLAESVVTIAMGRNGRGGRAMGSLGQSNDLGAYLAMFTAFAAAMIPAARSWWTRLLATASVVAGTFACILSVSRGGILALALAFVFVALRTSRVMALLLAVVVVTSPLWAPDYLKNRMTGTQVEVQGADEMELENSAQLRVDTWRAVVQVVSEHPLEGVGFTGLGYVLPQTGQALGVEVKDSAHNTYLRCLAEMGLLGLVVFVMILWRCMKLSLDGARAATTRFDRQLAVGLGAATIALAVSCAFGDRFFNILIVGNFWFACALVNDLLLERREVAA
jgi:O-antigen ligase